jgi:predicted  nucleic acid-binding Zn-ribbon protein
LAAYDQRIHECRLALAAGRRKEVALDEVEAEYAADRDMAKKRRMEQVLQIRKLEGEIEDLKRQVKTHNHRLNEISDTREYRALGDEIRYLQRQIQGKEEETLALMEEAEKLQSQADESDDQLQTKKSEGEDQRAKIEDDRARLESNLEEATEQLEKFLTTIPESTLRFYKRKAARQEMPVVWAHEDACGYCLHRLTPQARLEVRQAKGLVVCESCGRIVVAPLENATQQTQ